MCLRTPPHHEEYHRHSKVTNDVRVIWAEHTQWVEITQRIILGQVFIINPKIKILPHF